MHSSNILFKLISSNSIVLSPDVSFENLKNEFNSSSSLVSLSFIMCSSDCFSSSDKSEVNIISTYPYADVSGVLRS